MDSVLVVTPRQVIEYYQKNKIDDFPKRKNGMPNMNFKMNKETIKKIVYERKKKLLEEKKNREQKVREFYESYTDEQEPSQCIICCENIDKNIAILECGHTFCLSCMVKHGRENNNCPCCRIEFTDKPKKIVHMTSATLNGIIHNNMYAHLENRGETIQQFNQSQNVENVEQFISRKINEIEQNYHELVNYGDNLEYCMNKNRIINNFKTEIKNISRDIGVGIINWYKA